MIDVVEYIKPRSFFVEAHIADIHFGVIDPNTTYNILKAQFLNYLYSMNVLDIVSINGDLFDHKFMTSSESVMVANIFIQDLVNICKMKNATLILITGTGAHDADQLKMYYYLTRLRDVDVRVVQQAEFIYVKGKRILCIPEMYNMGADYYNNLLHFSGIYDACYMHGTFKGAIFGKNEHDLGSKREPVFDIDDFSTCRGPVISGHNHTRSIYDTDFFYCGSPIRWSYNDEAAKGFLILLQDISTHKYQIHFEPITSFRYDTINLDNMLNTDPNTIIQYITKVKEAGIDHLRVMFTINDAEKITILKNYFRYIKDISIETSFENQKIEEHLMEMDSKLRDERAYLFDENLSPEQKLIQYMNIHNDSVFWTVDEFKSFMEKIQQL